MARKPGQSTEPGPKGTTYLWNVKTGTQIGKLTPGGGAEAFSPDGTMLATAGGPGNDTTYLWRGGRTSHGRRAV